MFCSVVVHKKKNNVGKYLDLYKPVWFKIGILKSTI